MTRKTPPFPTRAAIWLNTHGREMRNIAIVALACLGLGLLALDPEKKVGYHAAEVEDFGIRHGDKRPGVRLFLRLGDGRRVIVTSRAHDPALVKGAEICVLETRGSLRGGRYFGLALPTRCALTNPRAGP